MITFDPMQVIPRPSIGFFQGLAKAEPGTVLVVDSERQPLRVLQNHTDALTAGEVRHGRIRTLYRVDVTEHSVQVDAVFRAAGDVGSFNALVVLACTVADPKLVVERGIHDVRLFVEPSVVQTLRSVLKQFGPQDLSKAEDAAMEALNSVEVTTGHDQAFRLRPISVGLTLDTAGGRHLEQLQTIAHDDALLAAREAAELARLALSRERIDLEAEHEKVRQQYALQLEQARIVAETELKAQGEIYQLQHDDTLKAAREAAELTRLSLSRQRIELEAEHEKVRQQYALQLEQARVLAEAQLRAQGEIDQLRHEQQKVGLEAQIASEKSKLQRAELKASSDHEFATSNRLEIKTMKKKIKLMLLEQEFNAKKLQAESERLQLESSYALTKEKGQIAHEQLRLDRYQDLLRQGQFGPLALLLLESPQSISQVVNLLAAQRNADVEHQISVLRSLIDSDSLEAFRIADEAKRVLVLLADNWTSGSSPGTLPPVKSAPLAALPSSDTAATESEPLVVEIIDPHTSHGGKDPGTDTNAAD